MAWTLLVGLCGLQRIGCTTQRVDEGIGPTGSHGSLFCALHTEIPNIRVVPTPYQYTCGFGRFYACKTGCCSSCKL